MMQKSAVFSLDRQHRYALWRIWFPDKPICMFIGLNPSTGDEYTNDPTIRRCESFAGAWGYGGMCMTNLFALRSTDPKALSTVTDPVGRDNNSWLVYLAAHSGIVIAAWGDIVDLKGRDEDVRNLIPNLYCLGLTKQKHPRHPLYVPKKAQPRIYEV